MFEEYILVADNCEGLDIHIKLKSQLEQLPCLSYKKLGNVGLKANFFSALTSSTSKSL